LGDLRRRGEAIGLAIGSARWTRTESDRPAAAHDADSAADEEALIAT
jgi:hypothetical protein